MATVTGYLATKMKEIFDKTIKALSVDGDGNLIATFNDNTQSNLGNVKGGKGDQGDEGPPGTTPTVLQHITQPAGGVLAPGETSTSMRITADLKANHWYAVKHKGDISANNSGYIVLNLFRDAVFLGALWRKGPEPVTTRQILNAEHIWKQTTAVTGAVLTVRNPSSSDGSVTYLNDSSEPRYITLLDYGPAPA